MSRGRDDDRVDRPDRASDRAPERELDVRAQDRIDGVATRGLSLPDQDERERVEHRGREYSLNRSETRALATVGAFRVLSPDDFADQSHRKDAWHGDWRHLAEQGLITRETITDRDGSRHVVALTRDGKSLLEAHSVTRSNGRQQEFYAGIVKPRELRHDSQLYRLYKEEATRIEREGGHVRRVVLDYELKRDYQQFLNRDGAEPHFHLSRDRQAFAAANDLPIVDGHLALPDLRIEYETEHGRLEHRDVELVTEHYSRSQLAGKAKAGFARYRASGSGGTRNGGTPHDPGHLERL